jgi:hypothetical protein
MEEWKGREGGGEVWGGGEVKGDWGKRGKAVELIKHLSESIYLCWR